MTKEISSNTKLES